MNPATAAQSKKPTWLTVAEVVQLLSVSKMAVCKNCKSGKYATRQVIANGGKQYRIALDSLPLQAQGEYWKLKTAEITGGNVVALRPRAEKEIPAEALTEADLEAELYHQAEPWQRQKADKYIPILKQAADLKGHALKTFLADWNRQHPESPVSYPCLMAARKIYQDQGITGLFAQYGKTAGRTGIEEDLFEYFKTAYLKEGSPSARSCWMRTLGFAAQTAEIDAKSFPSPRAFVRLLENRVPEEAIFLARRGEGAWNRKYAHHIDRDYSAVYPGECFVSDHAQLDVMVTTPEGKVCAPWLTAWRDFKTGKFVGWFLHAEAPNSDHIFQSFFFACRDFGLPQHIYIDNGKDYRARDFAGGKTAGKIEAEKAHVSMIHLLGIEPHFARPYNAQAKPIERDFLRIKESLTKHFPGYRGGDVVERPECLKDEIKSGSIMAFAEFKALLDRYITEILNQMPGTGKVLQSRCPDQAWAEECREIRTVSTDALKLFCMRTTRRPLSIGRNGVAEKGLRYWGEFMAGLKGGTKVYLRRDPDDWSIAWVFAAESDAYLGRADLVEAVDALARTPIARARLKAVQSQHKQAKKIAKSYAATAAAPAPAEIISHLASGVSALNRANGWTPEQAKPAPAVPVITPMEQTAATIRRQAKEEKTGSNLSSLRTAPAPAKKKIFRFAFEREAALAAEKAAKTAESSAAHCA